MNEERATKPGDRPAFGHGDPTHGGDGGITVRQYYASLAMQGLLSSTGCSLAIEDDKKLALKVAKSAWRRADALLATENE